MEPEAQGERKILLLGAGNNREKKVWANGERAWNGKLVTVDFDPDCKPDVLWDIESLPLPFLDGEFDEIHAYDCLEHWGRQGDWRGWFVEMEEYHRLLKDGGLFAALVPIGADHFADPGHTRFFGVNHFAFLSQKFYRDRLAAGAAITDYRWFWKKNFNPVAMTTCGDPAHHLAIVLQKGAEQ